MTDIQRMTEIEEEFKKAGFELSTEYGEAILLKDDDEIDPHTLEKSNLGLFVLGTEYEKIAEDL